MKEKMTVAVIFGGKSPEHDVSIVTGLQVLHAINTNLYTPFPIYIQTDGTWLVGDLLFDRENFIPDINTLKQLTPVSLDLKSKKKGVLHPAKKNIFKHSKSIEFDVAIPAFHGLIGEDGQIQGLFEVANIPYTGMRTMASALYMDKAITKRLLSDFDIPVLPCQKISKPKEGLLPSENDLNKLAETLQFPCCLKPSHLGSSIGVSIVNNMDELAAVLPQVFQYDTTAILETFIENPIEYNIAVRREGNHIATSAIERPKNKEELLDFKQKYLSGGGKGKTGGKIPGQLSQGMLSLTRTLNPKIDRLLEESIHKFVKIAFEAVDGTGAPRIDFLYNKKTNEIWLNEINPCPGSFGYFLWEAATKPVLFSQLLTDLIEEAIELHRQKQFLKDPVPEEARLFKRS